MTGLTEDMRRLRWRCRRGLLELDLVFGKFLREKYRDLDPELQAAFHQLLEEQDNTLLAYLNGSEIPPQHDFRKLVEELA